MILFYALLFSPLSKAYSYSFYVPSVVRLDVCMGFTKALLNCNTDFLLAQLGSNALTLDASLPAKVFYDHLDVLLLLRSLM